MRGHWVSNSVFMMIMMMVSLFYSVLSQAMTLNEFLGEIEKKNGQLISFRRAEEAALEKGEIGDFELTPILSLSSTYLSDKKQPSTFGINVTGVESRENTVTLGKLFSTGTKLGFFAKASEFHLSTAQTASSQAGSFSGMIGSLGVNFSQSLWQNFFGKATQLRWEREASTVQLEKGAQDLKSRSFLIESEMIFWNYIANKELLKIRKMSLERAQKIEVWVQRRVHDGISDKSELYNAQSLVESRKLQLISAEDELIAIEAKIRDALHISSSEKIPDLKGDLEARRPLETFLKGKGKVVRLDVYLNYIEAKAKLAVANEVEDSLKPDLVLEGSYNTNAPGETMSDITRDWTSQKTPTARIGLSFKYFFDSDAKIARKSSARKEAVSAQLLSEQKLRESETAWAELNRRYLEMNRRILVAESLAKFQSLRAKAESEKLSKGRTVTSNVIIAAQDADEAEYNLTNMKVEQRKMEAQGRLFVNAENL